MRSYAGGMTERLRFEARAVEDDGYGNPVAGAWTHQFTRSAEVRQNMGGEVTQGARLQGTLPVVIIVRADSGTRQITNDWQAVDSRTGVVYAIRAVTEDGRAWIAMDAIAGASS